MRMRGIAPLKIPHPYFLLKYTAVSIPIIPSSIPYPDVPLHQLLQVLNVWTEIISSIIAKIQ